MAYDFKVKISIYVKLLSLVLLGLLVNPFAQASVQQDIENICRLSEEFSVKTLRYRVFLNETLDAQMKKAPAIGDSVIDNHLIETIQLAHKEKILPSDSASQKLDKIIAFGEKRYQDCLRVMWLQEQEDRKYKRNGGTVDVIAECGYGCSIKDISIDTPIYVKAIVRSDSKVELTTHMEFPSHGYRLHVRLSNGKYCSAPITIDPSRVNRFSFNDYCHLSSF